MSCKCGDLNGDGTTDVLDVVILVSCILNSEHCQYNPCADTNGDGTVNVLDIVNLIDYILAGGTDDVSENLNCPEAEPTSCSEITNETDCWDSIDFWCVWQNDMCIDDEGD